MSGWYRIGNFYKQLILFEPDSADAVASHFLCQGDGRGIYHGLQGGHLVVFRNGSPACIISQIVASDQSKSKGQLNFELLVSNANHVAAIANILESTGNLIYVKDRSITILYPEAIDPEISIFRALQMIDDRYNVKEFTPELKAELYSIYYFDTRVISSKLGIPQDHDHHIIPERQVSRYSHFNPYHRRSKRFRDVFNRKVVNIRLLKYLLISGEDPNECSENDMPPILYSMQNHDDRAFGLMLVYGADPFYRRDFGIDKGNKFGDVKFINAVEYGIQHGLLSKVELIYRHLSYIDRTLTVTVGEHAAVTMSGNQTGVVTGFDFRFRTIYTELKRVDQLSQQERDALLRQFKRCFEVKNADSDAAINKVFNEDFTGPGKLVECIYMKNKTGRDASGTLIGLNLFELLLSKRESKLLYVHCIYSLVDPVVRSQGFMALLAFRIAFSLQQILPEYRIGVYYASLTHDSWGMIKDILHFPKYQTSIVTQRVHEVLHDTYGMNVNLTHDLMTCYIRESVSVKREFIKKFEDNLYIKLFYQEFLNLPDNKRDNEEMRAVPVFFYVGDESQALLEKKAGLMGVNFSQHTLTLARYLLAMLVDMLRITEENLQPAAVSRSLNALFYRNRVEPGIPSDASSLLPQVPRSTL